MNRQRTDAVVAAAFVVCWSSGFVGAELAARSAPVTTVLAWRTLFAAVLLGAWVCSATLNSLIEGASRISRSRCQASTEPPSSITRSSGVKHQPKQHTICGGAGGARTHDPGIMSPML